MKKYFKEGTTKTPRLEMDNESGRFLIEGRSIPENSIEFYQPLYDWLDEYLKDPSMNTILDVKLEYFNTSSSKCLVEVFRKLETLNKKNNVFINWFYEEDDEDMQESGEDFKSIINLPIYMSLL
ncbi:DUF1987 domain-containing protein [Flexithrix dorotheae]|uniref:DUF1987 domain-containing protein n=1 Tax=Flexithrix dorotheae TaxID=70993 RepID=UPI00035F57BB|nr:DUF1987 domain-containing protein [Flexithrix dorotheae]